MAIRQPRITIRGGFDEAGLREYHRLRIAREAIDMGLEATAAMARVDSRA
jgi:hypothetical protein